MAICDICGIEAKSIKSLTSQRHLNSQKHQNAMNKSGSTTPHTESPKYIASIKMLERRVEALEQQNSIIMKKLDAILRTESIESFVQLDLTEIDRVKQILVNRLDFGNPTNIDTLSIIFTDYNWMSVERAILDLERDGIIILEEGESQLKINGIYAILTRKS